MHIHVNPTISGGFVYHLMRDPVVAAALSNNNISDETDRHNLVKEIAIAATRDLNIDFDKIVFRKVEKVLDNESIQ